MALSAAGNGRIVVGERLADRYELEELVGAGGMSSVYRARDTLLDRNVALKILHAHYTGDEEYVERFRREARAVARLSHPNIVTVIDRGEEEGRQFIVFEYVDGENLKELVDRTGPLPVRRAIELALQMARALAFAHEHGLVHRDVKPQNVLLNGDGEAKMTDFGIARSLDVEHGMTQTGTVLGTSNYIAPEQAAGKQVDAHTDVYSLGVVLYELLTAEVPFPGDNFVAVAMKHINEPPPNLLERRPDAPLRLAAAIDRALQKDPAARFPSMSDFAAELDACLDELGQPDADRTAIVGTAVVAPSRPRRARAHSRWPLVLSVLALLAAAAVLAGVLALGGSKHKRSAATPAAGATAAPVHLAGIGAYDPFGDNSEHSEAAARATDGDPATYWYTQTYRSFTKSGVGLVLDAGRATALRRLTIASDDGGFEAQIKVGNSPTNFAADSGWQPVTGSTTIELNGKSGRYYLVWVRLPSSGGVAHVNEVRAS
jgi:eukaryotic-like serine/threonine-protein kinase